MEIGEILPEQLSERLRRGERPVILDVREPEEIAIASFQARRIFRWARFRRV